MVVLLTSFIGILITHASVTELITEDSNNHSSNESVTSAFAQVLSVDSSSNQLVNSSQRRASQNHHNGITCCQVIVQFLQIQNADYWLF